LDYKEKYRNLPFLGSLHPSIFQYWSESIKKTGVPSNFQLSLFHFSNSQLLII
jgi:hypothetical protein